MRVQKTQCKSLDRRNTFSRRVVNDWNVLSHAVITIGSIHQFKGRLYIIKILGPRRQLSILSSPSIMLERDTSLAEQPFNGESMVSEYPPFSQRSSSPMKCIDEAWKAVCAAYQSVCSFRSWIASERGLAGCRSAANLWASSMNACPTDHVNVTLSLVLCGDLSPILCCVLSPESCCDPSPTLCCDLSLSP